MAVQGEFGRKFGDSGFSFSPPFHEGFSDAEFESSRKSVAERIRFDREEFEREDNDRELPNEKEVERVDPKEIDREIGEPKRLPKTAKGLRWSMMLLGSCPEYGASFA